MAIKVIEVEGPESALYHRYYGQLSPQFCYLEVDPQERSIKCSWNGEVGNSVPINVWNRCILRFHIPCITKTSANKMMNDSRVQSLVEDICNGHSIEWDGSNNIGVLTGKAEWLVYTLETLFDNDLYFDETNLVQVCDAAEYLSPLGDDEQQCVNLGLTLDMTSDDLFDLATDIEDEAFANGIHIIENLDNYLKDLRDRLAGMED